MKIDISKTKIAALKREGSGLVIRRKAEAAIVDMLILQKDLNEAISQMKESVIAQGRKEYGTDFKSVKGERITISVSNTGDRYQISETETPESIYYKEEYKHVPNRAKIKAHIELHGRPPKGIKIVKGRETIRLIDKGNE